MVVAWGHLKYSVFIETFKTTDSVRWLGKVGNPDSTEVYSRTEANFQLSEGVISLRLAGAVCGASHELVFEFPVGHALAMVLRMGDRLELRRHGDGTFTYWIIRNNVFVIAVGFLCGKYGSSVEINWFESTRKLASESSRPVDNCLRGYSSAMVQLEGQTFELRDKDEIVAEPYYVKCLDLGELHAMPGRSPRIAILATEQLHLRKSFAAYLSFADRLTAAYVTISGGLFPSGRNVQPHQWAPVEYMKDRNRKLEEIEHRINQMYRTFGMRPPKSKL